MSRAAAQRTRAPRHTGLPTRRSAAYATFTAMLATVATLSACSLLPKPDAQQIYVLPASPASAHTAAPTEWSLRVGTPLAIAPLNSNQVIVQYPNASLASYHGIRWADRAPVLLRDRIAQTLGDSGLFRAVVAGNATASTDLELAATLRAFQLEDPVGHAHVAVRLEAQLFGSSTLQLLGAQPFAQSQAVHNPNSPDAVIAAFGRAVDDVARAMLAWLQQIARAHRAAGSAP